MKPLPTYENDTDIEELVYTEVTDEKLLNFFFKKGGTVNINNLTYCVNLYGKKDISQNILNLQMKELVSQKEGFLFTVTGKAKWIRFYSHPTWQFFAAIAGILATLISIVAIWISCR
ncbi:MAG: hypothetical protein JNK79_00445 [Chitinophagaceae bacterium]|nr:hypothetical protein [Chitinophagaceae bacterium]